MIVAWLTAVALAQAPAECPDPARWLAIARSDAERFFLADARTDVLKAVSGFACSPAAAPEPLGQLFTVQGLLWWLEEQEDKAARAFAAAKAQGAAFDPALGDELQPVWDDAPPVGGAEVMLQLEGRGDGEWLAVDGQVVEAAAVPPGLHLIQVGEGDVARFARLVDVPASGPVVVALPAASVPEPAAAEPGVPVAEAEPPATDPADPEPAASDPVGAEPAVASVGLTQVSRQLYQAPDGGSLDWRPEVWELAGGDPKGRVARRRLARNTPAQVAAVLLTGGLAYGSYVMAWDATQGRNLPLAASAGGAVGLGALALGAGLWEVNLVVQRPRRRAQVVDAAGREVATGGQ